jgi:hypothetical protein
VSEGSRRGEIDSGVRGCEKGVSETRAEGEVMSEIESMRYGVTNGSLVLGSDLRDNFLVVFVGRELGLGDGISEDFSKVSRITA